MNYTLIRARLDEHMKQNKSMSISWVKKNGSMRSATVNNKLGTSHGGICGTNHIPKYYTAWEINTKKWINVNMETISSYSI